MSGARPWSSRARWTPTSPTPGPRATRWPRPCRTGVGTVAMVDGAGHYPHAQSPDAVAELVIPFLKEQRQCQSGADPRRRRACRRRPSLEARVARAVEGEGAEGAGLVTRSAIDQGTSPADQARPVTIVRPVARPCAADVSECAHFLSHPPSVEAGWRQSRRSDPHLTELRRRGTSRPS